MNFHPIKFFLVPLVIFSLLWPSVSVAISPGTLVSGAADCAKMYFIKNVADAITKRVEDFLKGKAMDAIRSFFKAKVPVPDMLGLGSVPVTDDKVRSNTSAGVREQLEAAKKEQVKDLIARCFARFMLDSEVLGILNITREQGRDGGTTFVRNWRNFITNSEYRGEGIFRTILANTQLCDYLETDLWGTFGVTKRDRIPLPAQNIRVRNLDPFRLRQQCTMPDNFSLIELQRDFRKGGGWAAVAQMTQPENNPNWAFLNAYDEMESQRALEREADLAQIQANDGYTGISGKTARASCLVSGQNGRCLIYKDIQTPGSYLAATLQASINQELGWLTNSDEMQEVLLRVFDRLTKRTENLLRPETRPKYGADPASSFDCREPSSPPAPTVGPFTPWTWGTPGRTDRERELTGIIAEIQQNMTETLTAYLDEWIENSNAWGLMLINLPKAGIPQIMVDELKNAIGKYILDQEHNHGKNLEQLRTNIYVILTKIMDGVLKIRYALTIQNNTANLTANRNAILNLFQATDQSLAIDLVNTFDRALKELATGADPSETAETLPLCETTSGTGTGATPTPTPGTGEDEETWMDGNSLCRSVSVDEFEHIDDLRSMQESLEEDARNGTGQGAGMLDPNDIDGNNNYKILDENYPNVVVSRMEALGYHIRYTGEEVQFYKPGDDHDEANDIGTAAGYVRKARDGSYCSPPRF
jgi:hypothetical protein